MRTEASTDAPEVAWPREDSTRVPYRVYLDPAVYEDEQKRIFRGRTWAFLGLEAEVAEPADFKATFVGDTPVVLTRDEDRSLNAWVNRCAHRGAVVCRELSGSKAVQTCVYHQWAYDLRGNLIGAPFRRGVAGKGGYPADFRLEDHGLRKLRVESLHGMVFGTFDASMPALAEYLGPAMVENVERVLGHREVRILGTTRQLMRGNWKLYAENTRDSYHGGLLHLFYPTFGIFRPMQRSATVMDERRWHNHFTVAAASGEEDLGAYKSAAGMRAVDETARLADPSVVEFKNDLGDGISLSIQSLFPNVVLQQILNALAVRQVVPRGPGEVEVVWTFFGYQDDSEEMTRHRLKHGNLVGAAGFISMEDGEAVEIVQRGIAGAAEESSFIEMGGRGVENLDAIGSDENSIRGFWKAYREIMGSAA